MGLHFPLAYLDSPLLSAGAERFQCVLRQRRNQGVGRRLQILVGKRRPQQPAGRIVVVGIAMRRFLPLGRQRGQPVGFLFHKAAGSQRVHHIMDARL